MSIFIKAFADRNFRWIFAGGVPSAFGDQFTKIALPWLALTLSKDPTTLALVLAAMMLPRALLILPGGALVDRWTPRAVLIWTKLINAGLLGALALLVGFGTLTVSGVLGFSLCIGIVSAFSFPAASAILPHVVPASVLQPAIRVMMTVRECSVLIGSIAAGSLIAFLGNSSGDATKGMALVFGFDAFSFALSAWTMTLVRSAAVRATTPASLIVAEIAEARRVFWGDVQLRSLCLYTAAVDFLIVGPLEVVLPLLADRQLAQGADAFGLLIAAHGAGMLIGMTATGLRAMSRTASRAVTLIAGASIIGLLFLPLGYTTTTGQAAGLLILVGVVRGFIQVATFIWIQGRVHAALLGRTMGLIMFVNIGLTSIAMALTGLALRAVTPSVFFAASGTMLVLIAAVVAVVTPIRRLRDEPAPQTRENF